MAKVFAKGKISQFWNSIEFNNTMIIASYIIAYIVMQYN